MRARLDHTAGPRGRPPWAASANTPARGAQPCGAQPAWCSASGRTVLERAGGDKGRGGTARGGWANGTEAWASTGHLKSPKSTLSFVSKDAPSPRNTTLQMEAQSPGVLAGLAAPGPGGTLLQFPPLGAATFHGLCPSTQPLPPLHTTFSASSPSCASKLPSASLS